MNRSAVDLPAVREDPGFAPRHVDGQIDCASSEARVEEQSAAIQLAQQPFALRVAWELSVEDQRLMLLDTLQHCHFPDLALPGGIRIHDDLDRTDLRLLHERRRQVQPIVVQMKDAQRASAGDLQIEREDLFFVDSRGKQAGMIGLGCHNRCRPPDIPCGRIAAIGWRKHAVARLHNFKDRVGRNPKQPRHERWGV